MTVRRVRHDRLAVISILVVLVVGACDSSNPSGTPATPTPAPTATPAAPPSETPSPTPASSAGPDAADAVYDTIEEQVIAMRGLAPEGTVERQTIDEGELEALVRQMSAEETPPEFIAAQERLYMALGLLPADASLEDLTIELLSGGVAGFYRDDQKQLYVVSRTGAVGATEKITFAHEYTHALQDQHFTVFADQDGVNDRSDWILARQAVYEGDATLLMTLWASQHFTPQDFSELLAAGANDPSTQMLERMPAILRETLLYPYTTGLVFAQGVYVGGNWAAIDTLYADLPESTEQIMHADKWAAREAPLDVQLPDDLAASLGSGWSVAIEDTFGEFQLGIWLREAEVDGAETAAAGWGGDRAAVVNGPGGRWGVAWATEWDSAADAAEFDTAAAAAVSGLRDPARVLPGAGGTARWILVASDDATLGTLAGALGLAG